MHFALSLFVSCLKAITQWEATTSDGFRDFRLFNCRSGLPGHNCTYFEANPDPNGAAGYPHPHKVEYKPTTLTMDSDGKAVAMCSPPPEGQWVACFIDVEFEGGFRFTTQVTIFPQTYSSEACTDDESCSRMV